MRQNLLLMFTGFLLLAVLFEPAFSVVQFNPLAKTHVLSSVSQTSSVPHIVVDGNLSDWEGVYPIINGTSGDRNSPYFYGITECYVLIEQGQLYFVFQKKPGGSDSWQMFFDTDLSNETGYPLNGMRADYMLQMSVGQPLYRWGGNNWVDSGINATVDYDTLHGGGKTPDGSLVFAYGYQALGGLSAEWYEGKISLSLLGNPTMFGLIFELPWEHIVAPETCYIVVVQSQNLSLAASYTGAPTFHYGQPGDTVFNLLNFGPSNISNADLEINLPREFAFTSGQTGWHGTIPEGGRLTLEFQAEPLDYGLTTSYSNFTWVDPPSGENRTLSVPFTTKTVPRVSLGVEAPANMTVGVQSSIDITVANLDPLTAPLIIEADPLYNSGFLLDNLSLVLSPNSTIQLVSMPVMPTASGNDNLAIVATYNETGVDGASSTVKVNAPRIYMTSINMSSEMQVGTSYSISAVIQNEENVPYEVSFSIDPGPGLLCMNGQNVNITLPADSNTTVTLQLKAEKTGSSYATVYLNGIYSQIAYPQYFNIDLEPTPINTPILIAAIVIVVLIFAAVLTLKRKTISERLRKKPAPAVPHLAVVFFFHASLQR
jgi:hypothetical protein